MKGLITLLFKTLGTNNAHFKFQRPKRLTKETFKTNNIIWPKKKKFIKVVACMRIRAREHTVM